MIINDAKYYESDTATESDSQGDPIRNPKTVTHTSNGKGKVMYNNKRNFGKTLLSNRTLPVVVPMMNPRIDLMIVLIVVGSQTLLVHETKEVVADTAAHGLIGIRGKLAGMVSAESPKAKFVMLLASNMLPPHY